MYTFCEFSVWIKYTTYTQFTKYNIFFSRKWYIYIYIANNTQKLYKQINKHYKYLILLLFNNIKCL